MTVPLPGVPLADHAAVYAALGDAGFTDLWTAEVAGTDAFTPLALAAAWAPQMRLGTAIAPVFTRGPGLLAMTAAALAEAAPGRFQLGIGASSPVVVGDWNATNFTEPYARSRDMLRFLKEALSGAQINRDYGSFALRRFRLERPPAIPPQILLAALRPGMLRLAATEANGVILNWLSPTDVHTALTETRAAKTRPAADDRAGTGPTGGHGHRPLPIDRDRCLPVRCDRHRPRAIVGRGGRGAAADREVDGTAHRQPGRRRHAGQKTAHHRHQRCRAATGHVPHRCLRSCPAVPDGRREAVDRYGGVVISRSLVNVIGKCDRTLG